MAMSNQVWLGKLVSALEDSHQPSEKRPRLLIRPKQLGNQCRQDHLMRVAQANRLSGIQSLITSLGVNYQTLVYASAAELNDLFSGRHLADETLRMTSKAMSKVLIRLGLSTRSKICPRCLNEGRPVPPIFNLPLTIHCAQHGILLADSCPQCFQDISYLRNSINYCNCGYDLSSLPSIPLPSWLDLYYEIFSPWRSNPSTSDSKSDHSRDEFRSACLLRTLLTKLSPAKHRRVSKEVTISFADFKNIELILTDWPKIFDERITSLIRTLSAEEREFILYRYSRTHLPQVNQSFLRAKLPYIRRCCSNDKHRLNRKATYFHIFDEQNPFMVKLKVIREIAGVDAKSAVTLFDSGYFSTTHSIVQNGKVKRYVSLQDVAMLHRYFSRTIGIEEAATILSCSSAHVRGFCVGRLLPALFLQVKPRSPRFSKEDVDSLLERFVELASKKSQDVSLLRSLAELLPFSPNGEIRKSWLNLVSTILQRKVPVYKIHGERGLQGLGVSSSDLKRFGFPLAARN